MYTSGAWRALRGANAARARCAGRCRAPRPTVEAEAARPLPGEQTYTALTPSTVVPLATERLHLEKHATELGEVRVRKTVVAEERQVPVDLHYERVRVEERDLPDRPTTGGDLFSEETIVVPLRGEEAVVRKEAVITGEVVIGKELVTEHRDVTATVRAEHAQVIEREHRRRVSR